ncbi:endonuclease III domain-containing protein, partial [Campylobacter jejuni]
MTGAQIFTKLLNLDLNYHDFDWLENQGLSEFELLISVVLTQNTNWKNVLKALENLKKENIASLEQINTLSNLELATLIKPSGFYNTKTTRLNGLVEGSIRTYETLEHYKPNASNVWVLICKGESFERV